MLPVWLLSRTGREGTAERRLREGKREKTEWCRGGRDEFHRRATRLYTFLKGCASCSFRPHLHQGCTYACLTHSNIPYSHNRAHSSSSILPIEQEMVTFSFFIPYFLFSPFVHYYFPLHTAIHHQHFFFWQGELFSILPTHWPGWWGTKWFIVNLRSRVILLVTNLHSLSSQ